MNAEEVEKNLMSASDEMASYAVAALATKTPGIHYTPQPMYDRIRQNFGSRFKDETELKPLMLGVFALMNAGVLIPDTHNGVTLKIAGHSNKDPKTDEWVETGDWEFNVERSHFTIKPDKNTLDAIQALSGMPAEELRSVLGRVIDTVQMTMVSGKDPFSNTDLGGAASILCGVLRDIIVPGETIRFTGAVMCPGSSEGYIVHAMVSRLGFGAEPETDESGPYGP